MNNVVSGKVPGAHPFYQQRISDMPLTRQTRRAFSYFGDLAKNSPLEEISSTGLSPRKAGALHLIKQRGL